MPNQITAAGLEVKTRAELIAEYTAAYQDIYGPDINLGSDTPDGQMMNIDVQAVLDLEDLLVQINNSFDPDLAIGNILDQRVAINGIQRQAGTYTKTNITVVVDRSLTLPGLDDQAEEADPEGTIYTVSDDAGNQWYLLETVSPGAAGTYSYAFRAKNPGAVLTVPNSITIAVTVILGVVSINNPTTYTTLGLNEETDPPLRLRRQKSVSLSSQGYLDGLLAALLNVSGVTAAFVYENDTGSPDGDGVPGHSIWAIVDGGEPSDIATQIYRKRNAGCGLFGSETFAITQRDGSTFIVRWDFVTPQDIYIQFDAESINGVDPIDSAAIKAGLVERLAPGVFERVNINQLATVVQEIDPNCLVTNAGFSLSPLGPFTETLLPSAKNRQFRLDAANIDITVV